MDNGEKMIDQIEHLAARLLPYRKWMLVIFLIAFIGVMPAAFSLAKLSKQLWIFPIGMFLSLLGFTWSSGLFMISYWYNPEGGPLTIKQISTKHPPIKWYYYFMRYYVPAFWVIWFLSPFALLMMLYSLIKYF